MKTLAIHTLMHVPFEGLGCIEKWIEKKNHHCSFTRFYADDRLPELDKIDWVIVMGGPMGVYDEAIYPWLKEEKEFLRQAIEKEKTVLGICLGSQLIAELLGAKVFPNKQKEIGWFDIKMSATGYEQAVLSGFENTFTVFHWHGDTYDLPPNSIHLFYSDVCQNQAFIYKRNVIGLQFHFEVTPKTIQEMVKNGADELIENDTVQTAKKILSENRFFEESNRKMFLILDNLEKSLH